MSESAEQNNSANAQIVANLATKARLPVISPYKLTIEHGGLIAYAYEQPTREERDRVIAEMKRMLARYLFPAEAL